MVMITRARACARGLMNDHTTVRANPARLPSPVTAAASPRSRRRRRL
jgi:hypothetical protein